MKHPDFLEQNNSDTTSLSLTDFGAQLHEQRFNVTPLDVCTGRAGEEQVERALVLALYANMVPLSSTGEHAATSRDLQHGSRVRLESRCAIVSWEPHQTWRRIDSILTV